MEPSANFKRRTLGAMKWSLISQVGVQVIRIGVRLVLLNLLGPREFGLIHLVLVLTGFAEMYAELGLSAALIQRSEVNEAHRSSMFWLNVMSGLLLTGLCVLAAPGVARFYNEPELVGLTLALSWVFSLRGLQVVHRALLTKGLQFRALAAVQVATNVAAGGVAVAGAATGWGVWALVGYYLCDAIFSAAGYWLVSPWRPRWMFRWSALKELMGFSMALLGTKTLGYWSRNADNLLIGKFISSDALGLYGSAYSMMMLPVQQGSRVISNALFPSLSLIQADKDRVKRVYLKVAGVIACVTVPMGLGLMATAHNLVPTVAGEQWMGAVPILQILAPAGVVQSIATLNGNLFLSQGAAGLQFRLNLVTQTIALVGMAIGVWFGVLGVAWAVLAVTLLNFIPSFYLAGGLVGLRVRDLAQQLAGVMGCGLFMTAWVLACGHYAVPLGQPAAGGLQLLVGVLTYALVLALFRPRPVQEAVVLVQERMRRARER